MRTASVTLTGLVVGSAQKIGIPQLVVLIHARSRATD
jgi:hypothetical protein